MRTTCIFVPTNDTKCNRQFPNKCTLTEPLPSNDAPSGESGNNGLPPRWLLAPVNGTEFDCSRKGAIPHLRLVLSGKPLPIVTQPGAILIEAWVDCHRARRILEHNASLDLPAIRLRHLMWDSTREQGVLTDFDLESSSSEEPTRSGWAMLVNDLLQCKEECDNRASRLVRDMVEPYVWMLVSVCLDEDFTLEE